MNLISRTTAILLTVTIATISAFAQSTEFSYQGSLKDGATPANANYDFEFALFDTLSAGNQIGATIPKNSVPVANGIFAVKLDFGSVFPGANRFLEIRVRQSSGGGFTTLVPRQVVDSSPYSLKSLNADNASNATNAATATNASQLGGVAANQYVVTTDPRLSDARPPTAGSANYIQNTTSPQVSSNFNISGTGTSGIFNAATQYNIGGNRILSSSGAGNTFVGLSSGTANNGAGNSFFGAEAGMNNINATSNSFFGTFAGRDNISGSLNSFFGSTAGRLHVTGGGNSYFGSGAGQNGIGGSNNAFFGNAAGGNTNANENSFFGQAAGLNNTTGESNSFFGTSSGQFNSIGSNNSFFGVRSGSSGTVNNATAIGSRALVSQSNSLILGSINGVNGATADTSVGIGTTSPTQRLHVVGNGLFTGNLTVSGNLLAGNILGPLPSGSDNYIQNITSPQATSNFNISGTGVADIFNAETQFNLGGSRILSGNPGTGNLIAGMEAGLGTTGVFNSFFGARAGQSHTTGGSNAFFGASAGESNTSAAANAFFGAEAGRMNTTGFSNAIFGKSAGTSNTTGANNSFFGRSAGDANTTGSDNSLFGNSSDVLASNLTNASAFGSHAAVGASNSLVLGSINGVNFATADTNVGIGTTAPTNLLTIGVPEATTATASVGVFSTTGTNIVVRETTNDVENIFGANSTNGGLYGTTTNHNVTFRTNNTNRLRILNTGEVVIFNLGAAGATSLCLNGSSQISTCSSSLRYKTNIGRLGTGMSFVNQLRPISFDWKIGGMNDIGFGAEDVAMIDPRFVTFNEKGEVEGVKYDRLSVAFVNAFKEQQAQIEAQQELLRKQQQQIDGLTKLVCTSSPQAEICKTPEK